VIDGYSAGGALCCASATGSAPVAAGGNRYAAITPTVPVMNDRSEASTDPGWR
jgi:hypothetical protein